MELIVLGNGSAYAGPHQANSGYLVRDRDAGLLIDCGNGVVSRLFEAGEQDSVTALLFTHLHADHLLDIFPLFYSRIFALGKSYPRLPIYLPPGEADRLHKLSEVLRVEPVKLFEQAFELNEYDPDGHLDLGTLRVSFAPNSHPVPAFAVRVDNGTHSLVCSSDTGPQQDLEALARGADLLLAEATWDDATFEASRPIHLTPRLAAEVAARAGVRQLLLTHIWYGYDLSAMLESARRVFPRTDLAEELKRYPIGGSEGQEGREGRGF